jgi:hypothetical protein
MIPLLENQRARNQTSPPLIFFRAAFTPISSNVFLRNAINNRSNSRPHASTRAHRTRFMRRVKNKFRKIAPITTRNVLKRLQLHMLDARSRCLHPVTRAGNHHFASRVKSGNHRANGIITAVASPFRFRNSQLHELLSRFVRRRNHADRLQRFASRGRCFRPSHFSAAKPRSSNNPESQHELTAIPQPRSIPRKEGQPALRGPDAFE